MMTTLHWSLDEVLFLSYKHHPHKLSDDKQDLKLHNIYKIKIKTHDIVLQSVYDLLSDNPTCLHRFVFEINAIGIHWVKNMCFLHTFYSLQ